jgi:hypothetical protein
MHFWKHLKDLNIKMENKGEDLVITIHGEKEKIVAVEKKLKALKELSGCCCGCDDDSCC